VISKRVSIMAEGGGPVMLSWSTSEPYQSAIESRGGHSASIIGLSIRHHSPSIANNYAVFLQVSQCSASHVWVHTKDFMHLQLCDTCLTLFGSQAFKNHALLLFGHLTHTACYGRAATSSCRTVISAAAQAAESGSKVAARCLHAAPCTIASGTELPSSASSAARQVWCAWLTAIINGVTVFPCTIQLAYAGSMQSWSGKRQQGGILNTGGGSIQDCSISGNKLNGILVRDGADPLVSDNAVQRNGSSGISIQVSKLKIV
jgi:parallel beta-helix repeat protein